MIATPSVVQQVLEAFACGENPPRESVKAAVKATMAAFIDVAPGRSVEIRIPPYSAIQAVPGATHRRGTPPAVVETDARTWLELCTGRIGWEQARNRVHASGERSDLSGWLPLYAPEQVT